MTQKNYILKIENPCEESWISMTNVETGKFCSSCAKNVIDFTNLTDKQVIQLIEKTDGKFCGRLDNKQLNRIIEVQNGQKFGTGVYKLLTGLIFLSTADQVNAKNPVETKIEIYNSEHLSVQGTTNIDNNIFPTDTLNNVVLGKIIDLETKETVHGVTIKLKDKPFGTTSDINGKFKLNIKKEFIADSMTFQVTFIGFKTFEFTVSKYDLPIQKDIFLSLNDNALTGEVVVIQKRKWWQRKKKNCH